jgi:hypothetical protein
VAERQRGLTAAARVRRRGIPHAIPTPYRRVTPAGTRSLEQRRARAAVLALASVHPELPWEAATWAQVPGVPRGASAAGGASEGPSALASAAARHVARALGFHRHPRELAVQVACMRLSRATLHQWDLFEQLADYEWLCRGLRGGEPSGVQRTAGEFHN